METAWFYHDGIQNHGPVPLEGLLQGLSAAPIPGSLYVWRAGMAEWRPAGTLPELVGLLPPMRFVAAEAIAKYYRRLVLLVGIEILAQILFFLAQSPAAGTGIKALLTLGVLVLIVTMAVTTYQLTRHMETGLPILWALSMFIPCWNVIALLILSSKAQGWCQRYGIAVGFFGPRRESIEELKRRSLSSTFD